VCPCCGAPVVITLVVAYAVITHVAVDIYRTNP
jgi:hypothetical protein